MTDTPLPAAAPGSELLADPGEDPQRWPLLGPDTGEEPLSAEEGDYVRASKASATVSAYQADWREFCQWCDHEQRQSLPADPAAVSGYLAMLARAGARVSTMSRRMAAIRFFHGLRDLPDPTSPARVTAVWEGIRRTHGAPPDQAPPLMPPQLFDLIAATGTTRTFRTRPAEPDLAGARDRALLLVGFWSALRCSELCELTIDNVLPHDRGRVLVIPSSKTNQRGEQTELVILPRGAHPEACPVRALDRWIEVAAITDGPVLRRVSTGNRITAGRFHRTSVNRRITALAAAAGHGDIGYSPHSMRAGFVTWTHLRGASDREIAAQTRHRSLSSVGGYVRVESAWTGNAATNMGL
ncbi:site-specific integrase [Pseudonocardia sp. KRD291]|uniref:site-specific integrase n=1 Tax=Pseudonocardia sp. KRD291 TaxID=2792007 RepID=UPI001C49EA0C|nr:site-specific integrase [Pseudonocardia sp. KRD291]MBW0106056.1 tyrosine-type recombinase/integrase [Pseudonocardia sp. KRD291]